MTVYILLSCELNMYQIKFNYQLIIQLVVIIKCYKKVEMKTAILHRTEAPRAITDVTLSALGLKYSISEVGYGAACVEWCAYFRKLGIAISHTFGQFE